MIEKRYNGLKIVLVLASTIFSLLANAFADEIPEIPQQYINEASEEFLKRLHPAFLSRGSDVTTLPFQLPSAAFSIARLSTIEKNQISAWVEFSENLARKYESPADREAIGKCAANLKNILQLQNAPLKQLEARGSKILFDARSLQDETKLRGIGRFSLAALRGVRSAAQDADIVLLIDPSKQKPSEAKAFATVHAVSPEQVRDYRAFVQPNPFGRYDSMPALPILHSNATKVAIFYDFIPIQNPAFYLADPATRIFYGAQAASLRLYNGVMCISHTACNDLFLFFQKGDIVSFTVSWPGNLLVEKNMQARGTYPRGRRQSIIIASGNENSEDPRKNTFAALAAVGAATRADEKRSVLITGLHGLDKEVRQMAAKLKFRDGEVVNVGRISELEKRRLLTGSSLMIVASFAEGLSLPVIEAVTHGVPVVASRIDAHEELIGTADYLFDPYDVKDIARAVLKHRGNIGSLRRQKSKIFRHKHDTIERSLQRALQQS